MGATLRMWPINIAVTTTSTRVTVMAFRDPYVEFIVPNADETNAIPLEFATSGREDFRMIGNGSMRICVRDSKNIAGHYFAQWAVKLYYNATSI
jgi:hypothetical protein